MDCDLDFFKNNPPSCLEEFDKKYIDTLDIEFDGHGENTNPIFQLICKCGNNAFNVNGYDWTNPDTGVTFYVSPLSSTCTACSNSSHIFDIQLNGYDAVLGHGCFSARGKGNTKTFNCPSCNNSKIFELFSRFEYTDDLFDENIEEFHGKEKELFTWFSLHGKCISCQNMINISEDECA